MDKTELREILLDEFDMQETYMDATLEQIENMEEELKEPFFSYLSTKKMPDMGEGKYSCQSLVEKHKFTVIGAFLFLDWMKKDKEAAEASLMFL